MSFQLAIPWLFALPHCPPLLRQPRLIVKQEEVAVQSKSSRMANSVLTSCLTDGEHLMSSNLAKEVNRPLSCKSCASDKQSKFKSEIAIHFPGLKGLDRPIVWVFPELWVCLSCGNAEFKVPDPQLNVLVNGQAQEKNETGSG
jgi:hypothetical protein